MVIFLNFFRSFFTMVPTSVRLPLDIYEKLKAEAYLQERSISGQIIYILKQYYKQQEREQD